MKIHSPDNKKSRISSKLKLSNIESIFNMKPNSEYILTKVNKESENEEDKNHRVELFLNSEYKGLYYLQPINH